MEWPTFWCEEIPLVRVRLRRWQRADTEGHFHAAASEPLGDVDSHVDPEGYLNEIPARQYEGNPAWPTTCECGYEFTDDDGWQVQTDRLYEANDGRRFTQRDMPIGAMYDATWFPWKGGDGMALTVVIPPGEGIGDHWNVDMRAKNCTLPDDDAHRCWVRHGNPRIEPVTVDKQGLTCQAGAGSIQTSNWHGFLHGGRLHE